MKRDDNREIIGTLLVLFTAIVSGFSIVVNKFFVASIDPLLFTTLRTFFVGIIFLGLSLSISRAESKKFKKVSWKYLILIGIVGGSFAFWLFFEGIKLTTAGRAAFIHKTLPIYALVLGFIFLREKITKKQLISTVVMIVGLVVMEATVISPSVRMGDFFVLGATILWAIESTLSKKAMLNKESNWVVTFGRMFFGSLILFCIVIISGKINLIVSLNAYQVIYIAASVLILFLYVLTWYWGLKYINISKASTILLLSPVISLLLGFFYFGESISIFQITGSVLILIGAFFLIRTKSEKRIIEA